MASRVAAELQRAHDVSVEVVKGGLGELSVYFDDRKVIDTNRFWYPRPSQIVKQVSELLTTNKLSG